MSSRHSPIKEIKVHVIHGLTSQVIQIDLYNEFKERLGQLNISEYSNHTQTNITFRIFTFIYDLPITVTFANMVSTYMMNRGQNLSHRGLMDCLTFSVPDIPVTFQLDTFSNTSENPHLPVPFGADS